MSQIKKAARFVRSWALIFSMLGGIAAYFIYVNIPWLDCTHAAMLDFVQILQPLLIFAMLFITFCKVNPRKLRLTGWHWRLLAIQAGLFLGIGLVVMSIPPGNLRIILEGAMICFICPVATASAVVTRRLGGSAAHITTYTILINLLCALIIPIVVPLVHPHPDLSVFDGMMLILGKVFPLLLLPLFLAFLVRRLSPRLHFYLTRQKNLAFHLWVVALFLAVAVTVRYIMHSNITLGVGLCFVGVTLLACILQFVIGWKVGERYGDRVTAGQALGQKNTVFAIWIGYTFFTPITSIVGGFYSIFHNVINSIQLHNAQSRK